MMSDGAAMVAELFGPDFIDLNFGCPVKKVVRRNGGSGCLRDLKLVASIIRAVTAAVPLPVSVKIRSGFDESSRDPVTIARRCEDAGARWITLHPRTRADMYTGEARWEEIAALVEAVEIPVIGNGDVRSGDDARRMRDRTGCHGIMIARGSHGDPWIFSQARAALEGRPIPDDPDIEQRFRICLRHARNAIAFERDAKKGVIEFRKHLGWYTRGLPDGAKAQAAALRGAGVVRDRADAGGLSRGSLGAGSGLGGHWVVSDLPDRRRCITNIELFDNSGATRLRRVWGTWSSVSRSPGPRKSTGKFLLANSNLALAA